jgi:RES domain-containing protein
MLQAPLLQASLVGLPCRRFQDQAFRLVAKDDYLAGRPPRQLFDEGPLKSDQRFGRAGNHRGIYCALDVHTAQYEYARGRENWEEVRSPDYLLFRMTCRLESVLDLTDASVRRALKTSTRELHEGWEAATACGTGQPATWSLGHAAHASGRFDGIQFPSAQRTGGVNLLIFTQRLKKGAAFVRVHHKDGSVLEELPP